jgi:hypothetical protein
MNEYISWMVNRRLRKWILICLGLAAIIAIPIGELYAAESGLGEKYPLAARGIFWLVIPLCIVPIFIFPFPKKVGFSMDKIHLSFLNKKRNKVFEIKEIQQISLLEEMNKVTGVRIILNDDSRYAISQISSDIVNKIKEKAEYRKIKITKTTYH